MRTTTSLSTKKTLAEKIFFSNQYAGAYRFKTAIQKVFTSKSIQLVKSRKIYLAVIGHGTVGATFIEQVLRQRETICRRKNIDLRIFAIANTQQLLLKAQGISTGWKEEKQLLPHIENISQCIVEFAHCHKLENLILIDNTASTDIALQYAFLPKMASISYLPTK